MTFTTDPASKLPALATALAAVFGSVVGWTALDYDPGVDGVQADHVIGVGDMRGSSTAIDESGHQLGRRDWWSQWTVRGYLWLDDPASAWSAGRALIGSALDVLDADHDLAGEAKEAVISEWSLEPSEPNTQGRRLLVAELTVDVLTLMPGC